MRWGRVLVAAAALLAFGLLRAAPPAQAASCQFVLGFKALHDMIPNTVGDCLDDEQHNPANGDGLQHTTNGLLVWRKADNHTAFTDGYRAWVNGPDGLQERLNSQHFAWEGTGSGAGPQLVTPDGPVQLLQDFYFLINQKDYAHAILLWSSPPAPLAQFAAGYATTAHVDAAFGQPEGNSAAGHIGSDIPTALVARQTDGSIKSFGGCYTVTKINPGVLPPGSPPQPWQIQIAEIHPLPGVVSLGDPAAQAAVAGPCPGHTTAGR